MDVMAFRCFLPSLRSREGPGVSPESVNEDALDCQLLMSESGCTGLLDCQDCIVLKKVDSFFL